MTQQATAEPGIRVAIGQFNEMTDEKLRFAAQLGVKSVQMNTPKLPGETHWEEKDLRALVLKCQEYDLVLEAIESIHAELGTTTVLITHNAVIAEMADRVLVLGDGRIQQERRNPSRRAARELSW